MRFTPSWKSWMKWNNRNTLMKDRKVVAAVAVLLLTSSCGPSREEEPQAKPMVYEGMPVSELEQVLGRPDSVSKGGTIYDVEAGKKKFLHRWHYKKRTVVIIEDTVKVPNESPHPK